MKTAPCCFGKNRPCCSVTYCPLVTAWATTIHKFQGFEAGKEDHDSIQNLIIDPGKLDMEGKNIGLLYVAISRGKTMGSRIAPGKRITNSAIYFTGGMNEYRVRFMSTNYDTQKKVRFKKPMIQKRDKWVKFLLNRAKRTREKIYTDERLNDIENDTMKIAMQKQIQSIKILDQRITEILLNPNEKWKEKRKKYIIHRSFFG